LREDALSVRKKVIDKLSVLNSKLTTNPVHVSLVVQTQDHQVPDQEVLHLVLRVEIRRGKNIIIILFLFDVI